MHYLWQHVDDPDGDCGTSFAVILKDIGLCQAFTDALVKEGMQVGSAYTAAFPDRHIYCYWDAILNDEQGDPQNYPWNHTAYKGNPGYDKNMCPRSLDILARSLRIGIHLALTPQNMIEIAEAINRADKSLG
jgi:hypothetical protein